MTSIKRSSPGAIPESQTPSSPLLPRRIATLVFGSGIELREVEEAIREQEERLGVRRRRKTGATEMATSAELQGPAVRQERDPERPDGASVPVGSPCRPSAEEEWRVAFLRLNAVTRKDAYPLPRIDEALDHITGSSWFCSLDLRSGYWQVRMTLDAKAKTASPSSKGCGSSVQFKKGLSPKLQLHWRGPGEVVGWLSEVTYRVRMQPGVAFHQDRLAPYHPLTAEDAAGGPEGSPLNTTGSGGGHTARPRSTHSATAATKLSKQL
ncbi:hypothetical protein AAFF_G00243670 [Aldrovandia affinis]|uniref:Gag-pol polyprotein n=1 Tax=Aldrovandia affinis TaxID=143900 RepID=A0AAD7RDT1_9TELE|nr:hypothetical protein AAFF_G00243670 [Aldrovandia affinis]